VLTAYKARGAWEGRLIGNDCRSGGWEAGEGRVWGWICSTKQDRGRFPDVAQGIGAPDRVLPRRGRRGSADFLFGICCVCIAP
jgi:hypothetical protein